MFQDTSACRPFSSWLSMGKQLHMEIVFSSFEKNSSGLSLRREQGDLSSRKGQAERIAFRRGQLLSIPPLWSTIKLCVQTSNAGPFHLPPSVPPSLAENASLLLLISPLNAMNKNEICAFLESVSSSETAVFFHFLRHFFAKFARRWSKITFWRELPVFDLRKL